MSLPEYQNSNNGTHPMLSPDHRRTLYEDSAISPDVALARGYRTITRTADAPDAFARWQRRRGLLVPTYSPDGETVGHQLRPDKPITRKSGNTPKYETPAGSRITLDVNPLMAEEVRHGDADLWITEGCKKVDALASRRIPAVGIVGVWNFAEPGSKSTRPLPCWSHVRARGRRVYACYDADARTNPNVQEALRRLVAMLENIGAVVLVVYLPPVDGDGKAGVDDYLAAGGTLEELRELAAPYEPVDIAAERMGRDERLRAAVADLARRWRELPASRPEEGSAKDVALQLVEAAPVRGKVDAAGNVRVEVSWGTIETGAKVSRRTIAKRLAQLEARGFIVRREPGDRASGKSGAFVLRANVNHYGREQGRDKGRTREATERGDGDGGLHLRAPRLMWSSPGSRPRRGLVSGTRKVRQGPPPEARPAVKRLGKIRGAVLDALDLAGGSATLQEIADALQRKRARDIRRRLLPWLVDDGIVAVDGDLVSLTADWRERLDAVRYHAGEIEAEERNRDELRLRREAFHGRRRRDTRKPSPAGLEAVQRSHARREAEQLANARPVEELRPAPDPTPEVVAALRRALVRWPDKLDDYAGWWRTTLEVEDWLPYRPDLAAVELALHELRTVAA